MFELSSGRIATARGVAPRTHPACDPRVGESRRQRHEVWDVSQRNGKQPDFGNSRSSALAAGSDLNVVAGTLGGRSLQVTERSGKEWKPLVRGGHHSFAHRQAGVVGLESRGGTRKFCFVALQGFEA